MRSAVPASFELPPPGSLQFLALVPVILAAAVLTSPQVPDLDDLAGVPSPVTTLEAPVGAPELPFAIPAPVPKPRAAAALWALGAPLQPPWPTPSPTDAALASLVEWIPEIPRGCEDKVAHALHLQLFRRYDGSRYGGSVSSLPQSPIRDQWTRVRSHAPSLLGVAHVLRTFLARPPPVQRVVDSPVASPAEDATTNPAEGAAKKKGHTPQKVDPRIFSKALWGGWQEVDDPPSGEVDAGVLGGFLLDKFGAGLSSISDEQLNHKAKFTIVGVKPVDYDKGMKLTRHHTAGGWRVTWAESKKQPYTPWAPDPDREYPAPKTHRGGRGQKHRRQRKPEELVDLTATSESAGEPEPKYPRRYSPRRSDGSPPRRRSAGHRHDSPPPRLRSAYRDEGVDPRAHSSRHDHHAAAPLQPYPYSGDPHDPRVAMAHNPYAPPPWSPPANPHRFHPYFGRHPRDR